MRVVSIEALHADGGWRNYDFLKIQVDNGLVGWSEYNESFGGRGLTAIIRHLAPLIIGKDPRAVEAHSALMYAQRRPGQGGVVTQAIAAIENALLDLKAKALGVPVYELYGGPVRDRIRVYWSHCATYRVSSAESMQIPPVRSLADVEAMGREVRSKGYSALKTNMFLFEEGKARTVIGGFGGGPEFPDLNAERPLLDAVDAELAAMRQGAGKNMDLLVDLNFNFKTEGFIRMAQVMAPHDLFWVEIDSMNAQALAYIRSRVSMPLASGESLFGRRQYLPFFQQHAMDVCIIDVPWNGLAESLKIASMAEAFEINVAPHNFYGPLATAMSAHLSAVVPNLRIMEIDPDVVPWHDDLVTVPQRVENGYLKVPSGPGWGTEVNEATLRAHPPRADHADWR